MRNIFWIAMVTLALIAVTHRAAVATERTRVDDYPCERCTLVVNQDGTGDVTTLQEAADIANRRLDDGGAVALVLMPGFYDEHVVLPNDENHYVTIVCPGGPEATRVRHLDFADNGGRWIGWTWIITGLGIVEPVHTYGTSVSMYWSHCRFEGGYVSQVGKSSANIAACDFYGRTQLHGYIGGPFDSLTFHGCTLDLRNAQYDTVKMRNCTFLGPADTALIVMPVGDVPVYFENLTFKDVDYGIVAGPRAYGFLDTFDILNSHFEVKRVAITYDYDVPLEQQPYWHGLYLKLTGCEIVGGETAIRWTSPFSNSIGLSDVKISGQSGDAIDATLQGSVVLTRVTIRDIGGSGLALRSSVRPARFIMDSCTVSDLGGAGVTIDDPPGLLESLGFARSLVARTGGSGLRVSSPSTLPGPLGSGIARNTFALNGGDGARLDVAPSARVPILSNIFAGTSGIGLWTPGFSADFVRHNDAWANRGGDFAGVPDHAENLIADPGFCDPLAGDWHVQTASLCAPSGPYGQIGAFGVGCDATTVLAAIAGEHPVNTRSNVKLQLRVPGHALLDVHRVQPESATLSGALPQSWRTGDSDGDGFDDLELEYRARDLNVAGLRGTVPFEAMLVDGLKLSAAVPARLVPRAESGAEVTVQRFAIDRVAQGGSRAAIEAAIATRPGSPATLELFDVQGRRLVSRVVSPAGGERTIELGSPAGLRRGVYFLRLSQLQERLVRKVVLVR